MGELFGTDGVRGVANGLLTPELAFKLGRAGAYVLVKEFPKARIVIGKDTRISGDMLEGALIAGICSVGVDVLKVGILPTPAVSFLTRNLDAQAGIMISASHNPIKDNGIKFFSLDGYKLPDSTEEEIEKLVYGAMDELPRPVGESLGAVYDVKNAEDLYVNEIKKHIATTFRGMKVVLDCAFGAAYSVAPRIFKELNAEVLPLHIQPDGVNINVNCGSTHTRLLQKIVTADEANVGLAFDGDADRCLAIDEKGNLVNGDQMMGIFADYLKKGGRLSQNTLVATVMSNLGLEVALRERKINLVRAKVGDRYVLEEMKKRNAILGGEQSGHIIFMEYNTTGDGIMTGAQLVSIIQQSGRTLSELSSMVARYPQVLINAKVPNKNYMDYPEIVEKISEIEKHIEGKGRLLVRPSGTEPLIRVMLEGKDEQEITGLAKSLVALIEQKLA